MDIHYKIENSHKNATFRECLPKVTSESLVHVAEENSSSSCPGRLPDMDLELLWSEHITFRPAGTRL